MPLDPAKRAARPRARRRSRAALVEAVALRRARACWPTRPARSRRPTSRRPRSARAQRATPSSYRILEDRGEQDRVLGQADEAVRPRVRRAWSRSRSTSPGVRERLARRGRSPPAAAARARRRRPARVLEVSSPARCGPRCAPRCSARGRARSLPLELEAGRALRRGRMRRVRPTACSSACSRPSSRRSRLEPLAADGDRRRVRVRPIPPPAPEPPVERAGRGRAAPAEAPSGARRRLTLQAQIGIESATVRRSRHVAQWLEHHLDTVEVGGSIPPVPTIPGPD